MNLTNSILKDKLKKKYKDEKVFIVPINIVENIPDKFTKLKHDNNIWTKYDNLGKYIYRYDAEHNPVFQQLIPYLLIANEDESKFYVSKRIGGDHRLKDKLSLGFGGHINECDGTNKVVLKALTREMNEELDIDPISNAIFIGSIRDIDSSTNDHLGLVFIIKSQEDNISIKETDKLIGQWMTKEEMFKSYSLFEGWSKYILDYMYKNK